MTLLILGIALFFAAHSLRIVRNVRASLVGRMGENPYKAVYSLLSLAGIALMVTGFAEYRSGGLIPVWTPPVWTSHLALLLNWFAIIFFVSAYTPSHIRRMLRHPMLVGTKTWAAAHLLANGDLGGIILFGAFLLWAVATRISIKHRPVDDRPVKASVSGDLIALAAGSAAYALVVFWLHPDIFHIPVWPGQ